MRNIDGLKNNSQFSRVYKLRRSLANSYLIMYIAPNDMEVSRIEKLRAMGAKLYIVRNWFEQKGQTDGDILAFKPMFTLNFCECMNEMQRKEIVKKDIKFRAPLANILLAEDIDMNVNVAKALFKPFEFNIDVASNGKLALEMIQKKKYDLVLMDHMMPVMDGIEATEAIRRLPEDYYKKLPIIALSANVIESTRKLFMRAGMNDFISKPIQIDEATKMFLKWLPKDKIIEEEVDASNEAIIDDLKVINSQNSNDFNELNNEINANLNEDTIPDWFPKGLDYSVAKECSYTDEILKCNLKNFYLMIDVKAFKIETCLKDNLIKDYTIEVHGLKNTAKYIGAVDLSKDFERMEQAGNSGDIKTIQMENAFIMTKFREFKELLSEFKDADDNLPIINLDELCDMMNVIIEAVEMFDFDTVDMVMEELKKYSMPDNINDLKDQLVLAVVDVKMDEVSRIAGQILGGVTQ